MLTRTSSSRLRDERGAEAVEFALVAPLVFFLLFGLLYLLLALAAQVSLAHAASVGVRYAAIPADPVEGLYRSEEEVAAKVAASTPLFSASACTTTVTGDFAENAPVSLRVGCDFPNPAGALLSSFRNTFFGGDGSETYSSSLRMTASAEARRE